MKSPFLGQTGDHGHVTPHCICHESFFSESFEEDEGQTDVHHSTETTSKNSFDENGTRKMIGFFQKSDLFVSIVLEQIIRSEKPKPFCPPHKKATNTKKKKKKKKKIFFLSLEKTK